MPSSDRMPCKKAAIYLLRDSYWKFSVYLSKEELAQHTFSFAWDIYNFSPIGKKVRLWKSKKIKFWLCSYCRFCNDAALPTIFSLLIYLLVFSDANCQAVVSGLRGRWRMFVLWKIRKVVVQSVPLYFAAGELTRNSACMLHHVDIGPGDQYKRHRLEFFAVIVEQKRELVRCWTSASTNVVVRLQLASAFTNIIGLRLILARICDSTYWRPALVSFKSVR